MIAIRAARLATLGLCAIVLAGRPVAATAQEPPLLKRLYGFDPADPAADVAQSGPIAPAPDGSVINLVLADTAGPSRLRRFAADGRLLAVWAGTGRHEGRFERPQDVTVTTAGEVWVADLHRLQRFAPDGSLLALLPWPPPATAGGGSPTADGSGGRLAAAPDGGVAAALPDGRIWRLDGDGQVRNAWTSAADSTADTRGPSDVAVLSDGSVIVTHQGEQGRLRRFSPEGQLMAERRFGGLGHEFTAAPDRLAAAADGGLLTLEGGVVMRRDADGRPLGSWPVSGMSDGRDIAAAPDGSVFVQRAGSQDGSGTLLHFSAAGGLLGAIGRVDPKPGPVDASPVNPQPAPDGRIFSFEVHYDHAFSHRLRWFDALGQPEGPALEWPIGTEPAPFGDCPYRGVSFACNNRAVVQSDGSIWATDVAHHRLLHLAADGRMIAAEQPLDAQMQPVVPPRSAGPSGILYRSATDELLLVGGDEGRQLYRYDAQLRLQSALTPGQPDARFWAVEALDDGGVAALLTRSAAAGARDVTVEVSDVHGALAASFTVPSRTSSLTHAPDGSLWLFPGTTEGIQRFDLRGEPLPPIRYEMDASLRPRHPEGSIAGGAFGPDGRLYTGTEVYGFDDLDAWRVRRFANPWFSEGPTSVAAWSSLDCRAGCRDPLAAGDAPGAALIAERVVTVSEGRPLLVHARGDLRLWVDERLVVDQRDREGAAIDRTIVLTAGRHRLELALSATDDRAELAVALPGGALAQRAYLPSLGR